MNPYPVDWAPEALHDLAAIWMDALDRSALNLAERVIERLLARDPHRLGQVVAEGLYKVHEPPLLVYYHVDDEKHVVYVTNAYYKA